MPELNAGIVSSTVRKYFDDIKKIKFIFEIVEVEYDEDEGEWKVICEIQNLYEEDIRTYEVWVNDETGDITDVSQKD